MINTERRLSALRPVLPKEPDERNDFEVIRGVGEALGMGDALNGWASPREVFGLMKACSKGMPCDISGVDYDALAGTRGVQWPFPEGAVLGTDERRLFEDGRYYTPTGKAKFIFEAVQDNPLPTTGDYPYYLNTGRGTVGQWHTQTRTREVAYVCDVSAALAQVHLHPDLARDLGIKENDPVELCSQNGMKGVFNARLLDTGDYGELYAPLHYIETNRLTASLYDPYSFEPSYKYMPVNIRKYRGSEGPAPQKPEKEVQKA